MTSRITWTKLLGLVSTCLSLNSSDSISHLKCDTENKGSITSSKMISNKLIKHVMS